MSRRTQINTSLDNTPQTRERCQGLQQHVRQSPMSKNASCKKRCIGMPSRTGSVGANVSPARKRLVHGRWNVPATVAAVRYSRHRRGHKASDTCAAIARIRLPSGHHHARHATILRRSLRGHICPRVTCSVSMLARLTHRDSTTRYLGAMRQRR